MLAVICSTLVVSCSAEIDFWQFTKEAYASLTEKVEYWFGNSSVIITKDSVKYNSLDELERDVDLSGVLLPYGVSDEYSVGNISYDDFGEKQMVCMKIKSGEGEQVDLKIKLGGGFAPGINQPATIGEYTGIESHYDDIYQFEFDYGGNYYLINSHDHGELLYVIDSLVLKP